MKKIIIGILALCTIGAIAVAIYASHTTTNISICKETTNPIQNDNNQYTEEEVKRVKLYVAVMSAAFQIDCCTKRHIRRTYRRKGKRRCA